MREQNSFSNNFLNDLTISLENAHELFIKKICRGLKWNEIILIEKMEIKILRGIDIYDVISKPKLLFVLRVYHDLIGMRHLSERSLDWKWRLRGYYKNLDKEHFPPVDYSDNILNDLVTSLKNAPLLFRDNVCSSLNWTSNEFEIKRLAPVANDIDTYNTFNKKQIGHIIPIYKDLIVDDQIRNKAIKWKIKISNC